MTSQSASAMISQSADTATVSAGADYDKTSDITTSSTFVPNIPNAAGISQSLLITSIFFLVAMVVNMIGNGFLLIVIRSTPALMTKTNKILGGMAFSELMSGISVGFFTLYTLFVYVFNNPCDYNILDAVIVPLFSIPVYAAQMSPITVAIDRYVAIMHGLVYEEKITDSVVRVMMVTVWVAALVLCASFWFWIIPNGHNKCLYVPNIIPRYYYAIEMALSLTVVTVLIVLYAQILLVARRQQRQVAALMQMLKIPPTHAATTVDGDGRRVTGQEANVSISGEQASSNQGEQLHRVQQVKMRRHQLKSVWLTASLIGAFIILWTPRTIGRIMELSGYQGVSLNYMLNVGGALVILNSSCSWLLYGIVSKSYRKAYKRVFRKIVTCEQS